jgi:hypothetical protein
MANGETRAFKIGLVMAGAVSAGAYTAGVLDFLLQALDQWERAKAAERARTADTKQWTIPCHNVEITVTAGASAGGICAAIIAASLGRPIPPIAGFPPSYLTGNKLYDAWVLKARIEDLLTTDDLQGAPNEALESILNSKALDRMANDALAFSGPWQRLSYVAPALQLFLTIGNLRGVGYEIRFLGEGAGGHDMTLHADYKQFYLGAEPDAGLDGLGAGWLDPNAQQGSQSWNDLRKGALATSAFPFALAARAIDRDPRGYVNRQWPIPNPVPGCPGDVVTYTWEKILPLCMPAGNQPYPFVAVDGGIANNEPFDLAHRALLHGRMFNPRSGLDADRAVLMIDPFPEPFDCTVPYQPRTDFVSILKALVNTFVQQARFKEQDLELAQREDVFSRFIVAPVRRMASGAPMERFPLASGSLGAFGGFLSESFRKHDFELGRLNCQLFLKKSFALYAENSLFEGWSNDLNSPVNQKYGMEDIDPNEPARTRQFRTVIPLTGTAEADIPPAVWPVFPEDQLDWLMKLIEKRADAVVARVRESYLSRLGDFAARIGWWWERGRTLDSIREAIKADLRKRSMMP